ncbi:DUF1737 domain-containing protein [Segetibacter koreensis]|uniref:DUF1737 domain-containing protein n=1 Tax=Segetibacter koreensis TaxID=398037 RepID=UPI000362E68D|nr:DUF1737 domain-containing protein [Segetibacter koreensis]
MNKLSQYKIITGESVIEIEQNVNENINNGWEVQGGVSVMFQQSTKSYTFCQAMVKAKAMIGAKELD